MTRVEERFPFRLRGQEGSVTVEFQQNDDPERWGYGVLELPWPSGLARGLPVIAARVSTPLEGYAAGIRWGYATRGDDPPELIEPSPLGPSDWERALPTLQESYPDWTFDRAWGV